MFLDRVLNRVMSQLYVNSVGCRPFNDTPQERKGTGSDRQIDSSQETQPAIVASLSLSLSVFLFGGYQ